MKPVRESVEGWAWYAARIQGGKPRPDGLPLDGTDGRRRCLFSCPVRASIGIANRFPKEQGQGWLLLTETPIAPEVNEAWQIEPAELGANFAAGNARLSLVVASQDSRWGTVQRCRIVIDGPEENPILTTAKIP